LFEEKDIIWKAMWCIRNFCKDENRKYVYFIEYNDLVNDTKNQIDKIYDFLEIPKYQHNYKNIQQFSANGILYHDDVKELHLVKPTIQKSKTSIQNIPEKIKQKYSGLEIWRK
jgi:hypothetical protein